MSDFDKLDQFVRRHAPPLPSQVRAPRLETSTLIGRWQLSLGAVAVALCVLLLQADLSTDDQGLELLVEALDWDEAALNLPADVDELVALAD